MKVLISLLFYFYMVLPALKVCRVWGYFLHDSTIIEKIFEANSSFRVK